MSTHEPNLRALKREWIGGLVVVIAALVIVNALAAYFFFVRLPQQAAARQAEANAIAAQTAPPAASFDPTQVCRSALKGAQNYGIIPPYGKLSDAVPRKTNVQGRYLCGAATPAAKYTIAVDLVCSNLTDARCISLYSIAQDGGAELYHRQN